MPSAANQNTVVNVLKKEAAAYGITMTEVARALDVSSSAVYAWAKGGPVTHPQMLKLAFIFGKTLDELCDDQTYMSPLTPSDFDVKEFAKEVGQRLGLLRGHEFRIDVTRRVSDYLTCSTPPPAYTPSRGFSPLGPRQAVAERPPVATVSTKDEEPVNAPVNARDRIAKALRDAETFRQKHDLKWVLKEDGTLGAERVTVETFG